MDILLFIIALIAVGVAAAAVLLPSEFGRRHRRRWTADDDTLEHQLAAWR